MAIKKRILGNVIGPQGPQGPKGEDAPTTIDVLTSKLHMNSANIGLSSGSIRGITHKENIVVAVCNGGIIKYNDKDYSDNYWRTADSPVSTNLNSVTYGKDKFVAVGDDGTIIYSDIGITWTKVNIDATYSSYSLLRVVYTNDMFIAVGESGFIAHSIDGIDWVIIVNDNHLHCTDIAYGNGRYIVTTSQGLVYRSFDCEHWETIACNSTALMSVTFANGKFIVVGGQSSILYSEDGSTWENCSIVDNNVINRIVYAYNMYILCCNNCLYFSKDGKQWSDEWSLLENNITYDGTLSDMTCTEDGNLIIAGYNHIYYAIPNKETMDICDVINLLYTKVMFD